MAKTGIAFETAESAFGPLGLVWAERENRFKILRIYLPQRRTSLSNRIRQDFPGAVKKSCEASRLVLEGLGRILAGMPFDCDLSVLDLDACGDFQRRVLLEERKIPRGKVSTYRRVAERIGSPKAARAVGTALATNPFPLIIPCHRAVRSNGELGGFGGGLPMKKALLEMEGVRFDARGRVVREDIR